MRMEGIVEKGGGVQGSVGLMTSICDLHYNEDK